MSISKAHNYEPFAQIHKAFKNNLPKKLKLLKLAIASGKTNEMENELKELKFICSQLGAFKLEIRFGFFLKNDVRNFELTDLEGVLFEMRRFHEIACEEIATILDEEYPEFEMFQNKDKYKIAS